MSDDELASSTTGRDCVEGIAMTLVGMINNIFDLIVTSSSPRIVSHFGMQSWLGVVTWSCTVCGLFAGFLNTWFTTRNFGYDGRFLAAATCSAVGLLGSALSPNFWISCLAIVFIGFACNFGESVTLGYLGYIRKERLVKFWGIGTGLAGILGSSYSALCIWLDFNYDYSFYALLPLVPIYLLCYYLVLRRKPDVASQSAPLLSNDSSLYDDPPLKFDCSIFRKIWYYLVTVDLVYFAEYSIAGSFMHCAQPVDSKPAPYLYPLLSLAQHIGVLIFCASLHFFTFPFLWTMVGLQAAMFVLWLAQALLHWMTIWGQFVLIFLVGSFSGLNYVNTYDAVLNDPRLTQKEKEVGTNLTSFSVTIAVLASSLFTLLAEQTFLKPFVPD
jgi:hypothetical protein